MKFARKITEFVFISCAVIIINLNINNLHGKKKKKGEKTFFPHVSQLSHIQKKERENLKLPFLVPIDLNLNHHLFLEKKSISLLCVCF